MTDVAVTPVRPGVTAVPLEKPPWRLSFWLAFSVNPTDGRDAKIPVDQQFANGSDQKLV